MKEEIQNLIPENNTKDTIALDKVIAYLRNILQNDDIDLNEASQMLKQIQKRLGMPEEQIGDLEAARSLAHLLANKLTIASMAAEIIQLENNRKKMALPNN